MTSKNKITEEVKEEEIEDVGIHADKLVLHKVLEKYQSHNGIIRYRLTWQFIQHMKQFYKYEEEYPETTENLDDIEIVMLVLLMYFAAYRKLNESRQPSMELDFSELFAEADRVLNAMNDEDLSGLGGMCKVVLSQMILLSRKDKVKESKK